MFASDKNESDGVRWSKKKYEGKEVSYENDDIEERSAKGYERTIDHNFMKEVYEGKVKA